MATDQQETASNTAVDAQSKVEAGTLGFSNRDSIAGIFSASPIHRNELANVEDVYFNGNETEVAGLNGTVQNGHGFSEAVNLNYAAAPDMVLPDAGKAGGHPANAYVPNPSSPGGTIGVPTDNPQSKPAPPDAFKTMDGSGGTIGGGPSMVDADGMPITPKSTSEEIARSKKDHTRGQSDWTVSEKIDARTPIDPVSLNIL